ncbi:MAG: adenosylcobinamide-GDP ribazoletransferase [Actinomycetota bacterium]
MGAATLRDLRAATTFLTRLSVGGDATSADDLARGVPWFPVVGAVVGLVVAGSYVAALEFLPALAASTIGVGLGVLVTGAFHEDGLADTADAFGGARGREETLRVLKDPRLGTYGVVALVFDVAIRVVAIAALEGADALLIVPAAHAVSRAGAVTLLAGPVATDTGLGASYASVVRGRQIVGAVVSGLVIGVVGMGPALVPAAVGVGIVGLVASRSARHRIGGVTGDLVGCAQQVGEIVVLLVGVAVVQRAWLPIPWWSS